MKIADLRRNHEMRMNSGISKVVTTFHFKYLPTNMSNYHLKCKHIIMTVGKSRSERFVQGRSGDEYKMPDSGQGMTVIERMQPYARPWL